MKLYYFYILKALWNGQGKIKMYYGVSKVKKQLWGKRSIGNPAFCLALHLTGVHFRGDLQHTLVTWVSKKLTANQSELEK